MFPAGRGDNPFAELMAGALMNKFQNHQGDDERWNSKDVELLHKAWDLKNRGLPSAEPGAVVKWHGIAKGSIAMVVGPSPLPVVGMAPSLPFWKMPMDTVIGWAMESDDGEPELRLASFPGWALAPVPEDDHRHDHVIDLLRELVKTYLAPVDLKPGDLCTWKHDMSNRRQRGTFLFMGDTVPTIELLGEKDPEAIDKVINCNILVDLGGVPSAYGVDKNRLMKI